MKLGLFLPAVCLSFPLYSMNDSTKHCPPQPKKSENFGVTTLLEMEREALIYGASKKILEEFRKDHEQFWNKVERELRPASKL